MSKTNGAEARIVKAGHLEISNVAPITLIAGPCQLENRDHALMIAGHLVATCDRLGINVIFKGSYDKANRTSLSGKRGLGMEEGLRVLEDVRAEFDCSVLTDVHDPSQCSPVAEVVDVLQIPAFLCRQTDLLLAAGNTGKAVNIKKGQFLAPWEMPNTADKTASTGNQNILLTERGTSFGYNTLVADGDYGLHPFGRTTWRQGNRIRWSAGVCAGHGTCRRCNRCRRAFHRDSSGSGQCALRWAKYDCS